MKRHIPILPACLIVVALSPGCNGAGEVTGPEVPELMPKKVPTELPNSRMQPIVVERPRASEVALAHPRGSLKTSDPTPTPRTPACWKNPGGCPDP